MKRFGKVLTAALCCAMALVMLAACGSSAIGGIQKRFEDAGWTFEKGASGGYAEIGSATFYTAKKGESLLDMKSAIIMELTSGDDFKKFIEDLDNSEGDAAIKEVLKKAYEEAQKSGYINGNCMLVFVVDKDGDAQKLFKGE